MRCRLIGLTLLLSLSGLPAHGQEPVPLPPHDLRGGKRLDPQEWADILGEEHATGLPVAGPRVPPLTASGDAEISEISIKRRAATDAVKSVNLSDCRIELWFPRPGEVPNNSTSVALTRLDPIHDDTGRLLSTPARQPRLGPAQQRNGWTRSKSARDKAGPVYELVVDAPDRKAKTVKAIKGTAVVARTRVARLKFDDFPARIGKPLEHPDLAGLKIVPNLKVEDDQNHLELTLPADRRERVGEYGLTHPTRRYLVNSLSEGGDGGDAFLSTSFTPGPVDGTTLVIDVVVFEDPRTVPFEFLDVEIP